MESLPLRKKPIAGRNKRRSVGALSDGASALTSQQEPVKFTTDTLLGGYLIETRPVSAEPLAAEVGRRMYLRALFTKPALRITSQLSLHCLVHISFDAKRLKLFRWQFDGAVAQIAAAIL